MTTIHIVRVALTSFMAYAVMASIMSPLGIISQPIADLFNVSVTDVTSKFSFITTGILIGSFTAVFIFDWLKIKVVILLNCIAIAISLVFLYALNAYTWLPVFFAVIGICSSINLTAAAIVITRAFSGGKRASMLLLTDCFYSIGGISSSFIAAFLISREQHWVSAYFLVLVLVIAIAALALMSSYPADPRSNQDVENVPSSQPWPASVFFCATSLFLYMIGMVSLISWMPNYAHSALGITQESAGQLISYFFSGMFVSQIIMFFLVLKFPMGRLILITSGCAALINFSLWNISDADVLPIAIFLLGAVAGGLLKTFITYGTLSMANAPTKLVSFLMLSTGLGTAVAPSISSYIVENTNMIGALVLSSYCYMATFILAIAAVRLQNNRNKMGFVNVIN